MSPRGAQLAPSLSRPSHRTASDAPPRCSCRCLAPLRALPAELVSAGCLVWILLCLLAPEGQPDSVTAEIGHRLAALANLPPDGVEAVTVDVGAWARGPLLAELVPPLCMVVLGALLNATRALPTRSVS